MAEKKTYPKVANPDLAQAMHQIRSSSAASPHTDRHAQRRKGHQARGGRSGAKQNLKKEY